MPVIIDTENNPIQII